MRAVCVCSGADMHAPARPNDEATQVSSLIGDIYDAALDAASWTSVVQGTCAQLHCVAGAFGSLDILRNVNINAEWGYDPVHIKAYVDRYIKLNPLYPSILSVAAGDVASTADLMPYDEYLASTFHREWAAPQGFVDNISAALERTATAMAGITLVRHKCEGLVDEETRRRMRLLVPHFQRALAIGKVIDLQKVEAATFADTLDGLAAAMFLVDAAGRIVHANSAAREMLDAAAAVRATDGKFAAIDVAADRALQDIFINAENGDAAVGAKGVAVALAGCDGERYVAHILPLTAGARRKAHVAYSAVAAVFVRKAVLELPHPLEAIASTFKLTPAEMRVLMMIVQLGGVPEVAPVLGISGATVKTHLQRIFAKTDTSRQADLVKLVAGYMSPLGGQPEQ
jgi:DNA-binding CsgD family transcriptional regulator/PAS domain-containing protein